MNARVLFCVFFVILAGLFGLRYQKHSTLPLVAIANFGPAPSLNASIDGIKAALKQRGFRENETVRYEIQDVSFDTAQIPQMIAHLYDEQPKVMIVMTTPVAQYAKGAIQDIPLIYDVITDPISAGIIKKENQADHNMTGSSDRQDLNLMLQYIQSIMPNAKRVGLLYSTAEANDQALVKMMQNAVNKAHMQLVALPVSSSQDVALQMQHFKNKIDFLYVGSSGVVEPSLPTISAIAKTQCLPVIHFDNATVKNGLAYASYGVDYQRVGFAAGQMAADVLQGTSITKIKPHYPTASDHQAVRGGAAC